MRFTHIAFACLAAFTHTVLAAVVPTELVERQTSDPDCVYGPKTRACWKDGFSIATDFDLKFPTNGKTVHYDLEFTNGTCNPDGNGEKMCLLTNGAYPGPVLRATWGDIMEVTVKNSMQDNGTSVHWHGVRQFHSTGDDGVNGITECPLAPGESKTYRFRVSQFGTSWYHSHYSAQYSDGLVGAIVFDGPSSENYDEDLGPYMLTDWFYDTAWDVTAHSAAALQVGGAPPPADNILINGTNKNLNGGGEYGTVQIKKGTKYRLRLINMAGEDFIRVSLDGHKMRVMAADFIPVRPFDTDTLLIAIGQRYDVVITANQDVGSYWFRADPVADCLSSNNGQGRAIWSYEGAANSEPLTEAHPSPGGCEEPTPVPYWRQDVPESNFAESLDRLGVNITQQSFIDGGDAMFVWALNATGINVDWSDTTIGRVMDGNNDKFPEEWHVLPTVTEGKWNYWLIQQLPDMPPPPHPIHLHGHDFFVLGHGSGQFDVNTATLNFATPPRRDTSAVPSDGWLALAFPSNNPGAWLMHCHIGTHIALGLGAQFLESPDQIVLPDRTEYESTCSTWDAFERTMYWRKDDSGL